ncbi:MAG: T9SS type A sorting domain-containing protein [Bacteroidota bacterium]
MKLYATLFFFALAWTGAPILLGQSQQILTVDDFESPWQNHFQAPNPDPFTVGGGMVTRDAAILAEAYGRSGKSLRLNFDVSSSESFIGQVFPLPNLDLRNFHYLSFWVKSSQPNIFFQIELVRDAQNQQAKVAVNNYLPTGTDSRWRKVVIPLDAFWNLTERTQVNKLVLVFEEYGSGVNASPKQAEVIFDDILFGSYFPGYVKIDHFDDLFGTNATGANSGVFVDPSQYTATVDCQEYNLYPCSQKISYEHRVSGDFGGVFTKLGGGQDGWTGIAKDLSSYHSLHMALKAEDLYTNPSNIKVELKHTGAVMAPNYRIHGIPVDSFLGFDISFDMFSPTLDSTQVEEFTIVLEKNQQAVDTGYFFVDDIEFRAPFYQGPDSTYPGQPSNLLVNGQSPSQFIYSLSTDSILLEMNLGNNFSKLESIHFEYWDSTSNQWIRVLHSSVYGPFNPNFSHKVSGSELPRGKNLNFRIRLENYTGISKYIHPIDLLLVDENYDADTLFYRAFQTMMSLREPTGVYRDATVFVGSQFHPASTATTAMGILSLCIADTMGWISNAEELVLETLKSMNGLRPDFCPERNIMGLYRHFIDQQTGRQAWNSEFSSIDTGILTAAALFSKNFYPNNDSIALLADALFLTVDWASCLEDLQTGGIYLTQDRWGTGGSGITYPFNEYMLVAWFAKQDLRYTMNGEILWTNHYADPAQLPKSTYCDATVLTDFPGNFLSGFVHQFCYYLCHPYATDSDYLDFFDQARRKDSCWWRNNTTEPSFTWGFGAGAAPDSIGGYHADNCLSHPGRIASPHIVAGFIPVYPDGLEEVLNLYHNVNAAPYQLPNLQNVRVPWRFSTLDPTWRAKDIQGIDFSTMLLGIAAHPNYLRHGFFPFYNDYTFPTSTDPSVQYPRIATKEICIPNGKTDTVNLWEHQINLMSPANLIRWSILDSAELILDYDSLKQQLIIEVPTNHVGSSLIPVRLKDEAGNSFSDSLFIRHSACSVLGIQEEKAHDSWRVFPHPVTSTSTIEFATTQSQKIEIQIYNLGGQLLFSQNVPPSNPGVQHISIPKGSLTSGIYLLKITGDKGLNHQEKIFIL